MKNIIYKTCTSKAELEGILKLQNENHFSHISEEESAAEGFLTCTHTIALLTKLNIIAPHILAVSNKQIIAYLLTMTSQAEDSMPILKPMFLEFEKLNYKGSPITHYNYLVVGQVCVGKAFRRQGVLEKCYELYEAIHKKRFDFAITEINVRNQRSFKAHLKLGFQEVHRYSTPEGEEWCIVMLDWSNNN